MARSNAERVDPPGYKSLPIGKTPVCAQPCCVSIRLAPRLALIMAGRRAWEPVAVPAGSKSMFDRAVSAAEELCIVPRGLEEIELNVNACAANPNIASIEYWSSWPRTAANRTEAPIPVEHKHVFDTFAAEFARTLEREACGQVTKAHEAPLGRRFVRHRVLLLFNALAFEVPKRMGLLRFARDWHLP